MVLICVLCFNENVMGLNLRSTKIRIIFLATSVILALSEQIFLFSKNLSHHPPAMYHSTRFYFKTFFIWDFFKFKKLTQDITVSQLTTHSLLPWCFGFVLAFRICSFFLSYSEIEKQISIFVVIFLILSLFLSLQFVLWVRLP